VSHASYTPLYLLYSLSLTNLFSRHDAEGHSEDASNENESEDEEVRNNDGYDPTPQAFYMGKTTKPSAKHNKWNYRWRSRGRSEHVIQLNSDRKLYTLTFGGPTGFNVECTFGGDFVG
jgi:hypothetical protein